MSGHTPWREIKHKPEKDVRTFKVDFHQPDPPTGGEERSIEDIRKTGAAWVTEAELERLCDLEAKLREADENLADLQHFAKAAEAEATALRERVGELEQVVERALTKRDVIEVLRAALSSDPGEGE